MTAPVTAPARGPSWRGIAAEKVDDVPASLAVLLRRRSRGLLVDLLRPHRRAVGWTGAAIVVASLASLAGPWLVGIAIDSGLPPIVASGDGAPLAWIAAAFSVTVVVQAVATRAFVTMTGRVGQGVVLELRRRVFWHMLRLPVSFHESYTSGRVISRQTSDIEAISALFEEGLDSLVSAVLTLLLVGTGMLLLDWRLALVVLAAFIPLALLAGWFRGQSEIAYRRIREANSLVIVHFVETFGGLRAVQAFRREERNEEIFDELSGDYARASAWSSRLNALFASGITLVANLVIAAVLIYGGVLVIDGDLRVGVLASFLLYLQRFFDPLQDVSQFYNSFQGAASALEKLSGILEEEPSVAEPATPCQLPAVSPLPGESPAATTPGPGGAGRRVRFESVRFGYRPAQQADGEPPAPAGMVLPDFRLDIPAGQTVALVGETGAGKTTVARLMARFYDPLAGRVTLDGVDLRELPDAVLREEVVLITQESFLFEGTVADNIRLGRPAATDAEVAAAARAIGAHDFIVALPAGYATGVGKRGGRLSAGQRQLISFARAFIAAPGVLVLDEATALLDIPTERLVQAALRTVLHGRTAVIIAHRLSTVAIADRVLVLRAGEIIEDGSPAELIGGDGEYADLHARWAASLA
ncbi:MAG TPA: ABC transporter ATP-binding protein [Trebonia sp.]|jgi:ABC-type multidrug transport system fused ATPase/permease subunit|nr:ABC transporter ATP-binding protein [Trebonia sp.]